MKIARYRSEREHELSSSVSKWRPGSKVKLKDIDPGFKDHHESHKEAAKAIEHDRKKLCELQDLLYADGMCSLLICCKEWTRGARTGRSTTSWRHEPPRLPGDGIPAASAEEVAHDFLWRIHQAAPERRSGPFSTAPTTRMCSSSVSTTWFRKPSGPAVTTESTISRKNLSRTTPTFSSSTLHISKEEQLKRFKDSSSLPTTSGSETSSWPGSWWNTWKD